MIVYLDVDGVLASFNKAMYQVFGLPYSYHFIEKWHWFPTIHQTTETVSAKCTFDVVSNFEWIHDGRTIFDLVATKFNQKNIYLLTTPMPNVEFASGRWAWIKKHLPDFYWQTIICPAPKKLLAKPDTLLIDDNTKNVDEFRQAGGQTILVPRPWNSLHLFADKSAEIVKQQLAEVKCHEF